MLRKRMLRKVMLLLLPALGLFLAAPDARAQQEMTGGPGGGHCPGGCCTTGTGAFSFLSHGLLSPKVPGYVPRAPCLQWYCKCPPKPLCNPCDLPNAGYWPTCWRPWVYQVNYSHCCLPPPAVLAPHANAPQAPAPAPAEPEEKLPAPSKMK